MASIIQTKAGSYRVQVRKAGAKPLTRTFRTRQEAARWARQTEVAIESGAVVRKATGATVGDAITAYIKLREDGGREIKPGSNEVYMLRYLERDLGDEVISGLLPQRIATYCSRRAADGPGPYTIGMEVSKLGTVLKYASVSLGETFPDIVAQARPLLTHLGLIGPGNSRDRRPTPDELEAVSQAASPLLRDVIDFALDTCMRRGEIVSVRWDDVDEAGKMLTIRDRKDPRRKSGNDERIPLLGDALAIIQRQPRTGDRVFPVTPEWVSDNFLLACRVAKVEDLVFHDLRHEGISRLFERGFRIEQVALVSGHKSWQMLRRYTQLKPESLHAGP
jgi:integrase